MAKPTGKVVDKSKYKCPFLSVDVILERDGQVLLIERRNPPHGWALPGGFVDYGESVESAAVREAQEELGLDVELVRQFHTYSEPGRDPRQHVASVVFVARFRRPTDQPKAGDDAKTARFFPKDALPPLAFDHAQVLADYFARKY